MNEQNVNIWTSVFWLKIHGFHGIILFTKYMIGGCHDTGRKIQTDDPTPGGRVDCQACGTLHCEYAGVLLLQHGRHLFCRHAQRHRSHRCCGCNLLHDGSDSGHRLLLRPRQRQLHLPVLRAQGCGGGLRHGLHGLFLCPYRRRDSLHCGADFFRAHRLGLRLHRHHFAPRQGLFAGDSPGSSLDDWLLCSQ